jgi:hypothetical protein
MELADKVGEVISFLVGGATGVEDLVLHVGAVLAGVGVTVVVLVIGTWMLVDKDVDGDDLTTEEMLREVETEVTVGALIEFEHGILTEAAAGVEVEVGVGAIAVVVVPVAAGLEVAVAAIAAVAVHVGVVAVVVAIAVAAAPNLQGVLSQNFLIRLISCHLKQELLILKCSLYLATPKEILFWEQSMWSSYLLWGTLAQIIQRL